MDWCEWFGFRFDPFFDKPLESDAEMKTLLVIDKSMEEHISPLLKQMSKVPFLSLVIGDRGVGKSTFLYYSMNQALESSYLPVYLGLDHIQLEFSRRPTLDIAAALVYEFGAKLLDAILKFKRSFFSENQSLLLNFAKYLGLEFEETEGFVPSGKPYRLDFFEQKRYILTILNLLKRAETAVLLSIDNLDKLSKLETLKDFFMAPFAQTFLDDLKKGGVSILIAMDVSFSPIKKQNAKLKYLAQDIQINPLSPTQAVELLTKRVKFSNDPQPRNPFENEAMVAIGLGKKGNTRDILTEARNLCMKAYEQKLSHISKEFAQKGLVSFSESRTFYEILDTCENLRESVLILGRLAADPTLNSGQIVNSIKDVMSGKKIVVSDELLNALLDSGIIKSNAHEKYILSQSISDLFEVARKSGWNLDRFLDWIFGKESLHILSGEIPGINAQISLDQFGPIPHVSKATTDIIVGDTQQAIQTRILRQKAVSGLAEAKRIMEKYRTLTWDDIDNVTTFKEINWALMGFLNALSNLYISCATSKVIRLKSLKPTDLVENAVHHFQEEYGVSFKSFHRFQRLRANMNGLLRGGFSPSHSDVKAAFDDFQEILTEFTSIWQGISDKFSTLEVVDERHDSTLKEVMAFSSLLGYSIERDEYRRFKINGEMYYRLGFLKFPLDETHVDIVREKRLKNRLGQDQSYFLICSVKPDSKSKATVKEVLAFIHKCNDLAAMISEQSSDMPEGWPRYLLLYVSVSGFEPGIWAALKSTARFPGSHIHLFDHNGLQNAKRRLSIGKRVPKESVSEEELKRLWAKDLEQLLRLRLYISGIIRERFEKTTTILLADMKDFTRRTSRDTLESAEAVQKLSDVLEKNVKKYNGVGTNTEGDSYIATFDRPEFAALASLDSISELDHYNRNVKEENKIYVRIGICVGDVLFKGDRPFIGDAVNTAARIMKEAEPNRVVTTEQTYKQISAMRNFEFKNLGPKELKGIDKPLVIYEIQLKATSEPNTSM